MFLSVNAESSTFPLFTRNLSDDGLFLDAGSSASLNAVVAAFRKRRLADGQRLEGWIKRLCWLSPVPIHPGG